MNMRRTVFASAALMALAGAGMIEASPSVEPGEEPRRTRHKPSGSKPVPGGGAKERARRLAKMKQADTGCDDDKLPGTADDWRKSLQPED